jgi:hypothetical protein
MVEFQTFPLSPALAPSEANPPRRHNFPPPFLSLAAAWSGRQESPHNAEEDGVGPSCAASRGGL